MATRGIAEREIRDLLYREDRRNSTTTFLPPQLLSQRRANRLRLDTAIDDVSFRLNFVLLLLFFAGQVLRTILIHPTALLHRYRLARRRRLLRYLNYFETKLGRLIALFYWFFICRKACYHGVNFLEPYFFSDHFSDLHRASPGSSTLLNRRSDVLSASRQPALTTVEDKRSGSGRIPADSLRRIYRELVLPDEPVIIASSASSCTPRPCFASSIRSETGRRKI